MTAAAWNSTHSPRERLQLHNGYLRLHFAVSQTYTQGLVTLRPAIFCPLSVAPHDFLNPCLTQARFKHLRTQSQAQGATWGKNEQQQRLLYPSARCCCFASHRWNLCKFCIPDGEAGQAVCLWVVPLPWLTDPFLAFLATLSVALCLCTMRKMPSKELEATSWCPRSTHCFLPVLLSCRLAASPSSWGSVSSVFLASKQARDQDQKVVKGNTLS